MELVRRLLPVLVCGLVMVVVHALVWIRISPVTVLESAEDVGDGPSSERGAVPASVGFGDSWSARPAVSANGEAGARTSVKLIRSVRFLLLEGTVPTEVDRARVEQAVRSSEPEMQIRNRIRVDAGAGSAPWLSGFPEWWPRLKERVSDPELDAWAEPPVCRLWGEVPSEADVERLSHDFKALMGAGTEVDCGGLRWKGARDKEETAPSANLTPTGGDGGESWVMVVVVKEGVLVAGRSGDPTLGERLERALGGSGVRMDLSDLRWEEALVKEAWCQGLPEAVRSLVALSGDGILEIRQGEAWLAARARSAEEGEALERGARALLEGRLRVKAEIFSQEGTRSGLREQSGGLTVYFGVGQAEVPELERRKIERFAEEAGSLVGGGVVRMIAYASGAEPEMDADLARQRAESVLRALPAVVLERFRPEIETRRPGWSAGGVVFRQDQQVELEVLRLH